MHALKIFNLWVKKKSNNSFNDTAEWWRELSMTPLTKQLFGIF
jgi:hypothetical protein